MKRSNYRSSIPAKSLEKVEENFANGSKKSSFFIGNGQKVGFREWNEDGGLEFEYAIKNEAKHGREYQFYANGQVLEVTPYRNGILHGTGKQWSHDGWLLITYKLIKGVGLDLWCDSESGTLAEEMYWPGVGEPGYKRQWNDDEQTIWQEYFWVLGKGFHGVWREWNAKGGPRRGFPKFYVAGKVVTKREYLRKRKTDASLLPYSPAEDEPVRRLPAEYLAQRKQRSKSTK